MGVGGQCHTPAALSPVKTRNPSYRRPGGPEGRSGQMQKLSPPTRIQSPDLPARSELLYQLSYRGAYVTPMPDEFSSHANSEQMEHTGTICGQVKQSLYRPGEALRLQEVEAPRFQDIWHMKVVRLSALRIGCLYPPGNIPGTHFC